MNVSLFVWTIVFACVFEVSRSNNQDQFVQTQILSQQQMKQIEINLAHFFDLPKRKFTERERQKRMARSESKFLLELYHRKHGTLKPNSGKEYFQQYKATAKDSNYIVTFGAKYPGVNHTRSDIVMDFYLSSFPKNSRLIAAELMMFRNPGTERQNQNYNISTCSYDQNGNFSKLNHDVWTAEHYGWIVINVTNMFVNEIDNFVRIYVSAKVDKWIATMKEDVGVSSLDSAYAERPFLVIYFNANLNLKAKRLISKEKQRNQRSVAENTKPMFRKFESKACSVKVLYVKFKMLSKFTSVIMPEGYHANYCAGTCNFPLQGQSTNHAIIQALYSTVKFDLEPQCAPKQLSSMDVIHLDSGGKMIHKTYGEMVVKECTCH